MAKRNPIQETWQQAKAERLQRESAKKYRRRILRTSEKQQSPARDFDLNRIMAEAVSEDEETRARAVRNLCPCRVGWDSFEEGMEVVNKMRKDPSLEVRRQALHVFEDAYQMASEALPTSPQTITNEMAARRRQMRWRSNDKGEDAAAYPNGDGIKRARERERQLKRQHPCG
jgi:hypothetical protein